MQRFIKLEIFLIITILLLCSSLALAVDLNAPAEKKVTIGSEILRGSNAIFDVDSKISAANHLGRLKAFTAVFDRNQQANKDTQAFQLGASLAAWSRLDITLEMAAQNPNSVLLPAGEIRLVENSTKLYFKDVRKLQKELTIDDKTACEAAHLNYGALKANFYRWDKKIN